MVDAINKTHENTPFLSGVPLAPEIRATGDLADMAGRDALLLVTPAQALRAVAGTLMAYMSATISPWLSVPRAWNGTPTPS